MKILFVSLLALSSLNVCAQKERSVLLKEINKDIWIPFIEGVNKNITHQYVGVHSADFNWVAGGTKTRIMSIKQYEEDSEMVMQKRSSKKVSSEMQIRFLERNVSDDFASEKCVIRFAMISEGEEPKVSYGITQFFSRKEKDGWKMLVQYVEPQPATAEVYEQANSLSEL